MSTISETALARFICARLPLLPVPGVSEIRLHKARPDSGLSRFLASSATRPPYWAHHWGGGLALARYILDRPQIVRGKRILDLGAGSGLLAIAARRAGADAADAAEIDTHAVVAMRLNCLANGVEIRIIHADILDDAPLPVDLVLVGDLFYERRLAQRTLRYLDRCLEAGSEVVIGDPYRAFLPLSRLDRLAETVVMETAGTFRAAGIFRLNVGPKGFGQRGH